MFCPSEEITGKKKDYKMGNREFSGRDRVMHT
jgi:hypothetical protein